MFRFGPRLGLKTEDLGQAEQYIHDARKVDQCWASYTVANQSIGIEAKIDLDDLHVRTLEEIYRTFKKL